MIEQAVRQVDSLVQSFGALGSDIAGSLPFTGGESGTDDWFAMRNPEYIRRTLPGMKTFANTYHRAEVTGLENIPAEGPVLLVGNHSGGTLISDTFVFSSCFYDHFGPMREFHQLAHDMVLKVP